MKLFKTFSKKKINKDLKEEKLFNLFNEKISKLEEEIKILRSKIESLEETISKMQNLIEDKNQVVSILYKSGLSTEKISEFLDIPIGEVELIINLLKTAR